MKNSVKFSLVAAVAMSFLSAAPAMATQNVADDAPTPPTYVVRQVVPQMKESIQMVSSTGPTAAQQAAANAEIAAGATCSWVAIRFICTYPQTPAE